MSTKFSLIIPTIKQTTMVRDCIHSIRKFEKTITDYEIIVVDDGSDHGVQRWLKDMCAQENVRLILKEQNRGFSHTVNIGLRNAVGQYLVLVNNDIVFFQPFLDNLEKAFKSDSKIGVVGAKLLYPNNKIQHCGVSRVPNTASFLHVDKNSPRDNPATCKSKYFISVTGALYAIRRIAYERVGNFNEDYFVACEDTEYSLRVWGNGYRVFYAHDVEAYHLEGGTRGNDDKSKLKKGPEWFLKERETWSKFNEDFKRIDAKAIEVRIASLNRDGGIEAPTQAGIKLEIGCGYNPQPGFEHLDVRKLPHVEYVCDFAQEPLPFEANTLEEILSNHSIEHISFRKLPFVLGEWFRTLKPGGRVFLRTPDLEFICKTYLAGGTTPEWPGDEAFVKANLSTEVTPAWWANLKLFAGQDYPSNFHFLCFDFPMIKSLLERIGFDKVARLKIEPVFSPGELQVEAYKPIPTVANVSSTKRRILVKRKGALGDVILTTPIVRELRRGLSADSVVNVATDCPSVYLNNPDVGAVFPSNHPTQSYDKIVDLDLAYERQPSKHIIEAYSEVAFGADYGPYDRSTVLSPSQQDFEAVDAIMLEKGLVGGKNLVVHMAVTWKNRTWPKEFWNMALARIRSNGINVIQIGAGADHSFDVADWISGEGRVVNLTKKLTIHQIAALMTRADCFASNDSGMLHVAGTTTVPIVGIFTSAKGEYRVPFRAGEYGWKTTILKPTVNCYGCLEKEPAPVVFCDCRRGDYACLSQVSPDMVFEAVQKACNP